MSDEAQPYKTMTFGRGEIPAGLLREHRLAKTTRGVLEVLDGTVTFVDARGGRRELAAGDAIEIAPASPHALEHADEASIRISFFRA